MPVLAVDPASHRAAWRQVADTIADAIRCGMLAAGEPLPLVREMSDLQGLPVAIVQHALAVLADEGLVVVRQGRTAIVAGDVSSERRPGGPRVAATTTAGARGVCLISAGRCRQELPAPTRTPNWTANHHDP